MTAVIYPHEGVMSMGQALGPTSPFCVAIDNILVNEPSCAESRLDTAGTLTFGAITVNVPDGGVEDF